MATADFNDSPNAIPKLKPGLYESVLNAEIEQSLKQQAAANVLFEKIETTEAPFILSRYLRGVLESTLGQMLTEKTKKANSETDNDRTDTLVTMINKIISVIDEEQPGVNLKGKIVSEECKQLTQVGFDNVVSLKEHRPQIERPETSLSISSLFTGSSANEPKMFNELRKEIASADKIILLVSFIKNSGLRLILKDLEDFTSKRGKTLEVITTTYMGASDAKCIVDLNALPNSTVKISYDTAKTRLHAKSYIFLRDTGFSTAYIGSSNISGAALSTGLEWNLKITNQDQPQILKKILATVSSYWNSSEFETYDESQYEKLCRCLKQEKGLDKINQQVLFDITPYTFQQEILDELETAREVRGETHNLLVAATGCGKTVISALDYRNYCRKNPKRQNKLLFIAHREEILSQSIATFRNVLRDPNFGELLSGNYSPGNAEYLFATIQSANSQAIWDKLPAGYYDFIIIDESHHSAAQSYSKILDYFKPQILLGLTATPERMDGNDILKYFNGHIAAEIRLPEAIDKGLLCPFQYFGVTDDIDLSQIKWTRNGYEASELENVYVLNTELAHRRLLNIHQNLLKYVTDISKVHGLGFCVSIKHATFMASEFNKLGISSMALSSETSLEDRNQVKQKLISGEVKFIFVVDLYNEGVDIPIIDTILFLRPTQSLTVFLQQLGRGLRHAPNKDCLTVLDFIGQANEKYNFNDKFMALLQRTKRKNLKEEVNTGFTSLPRGCYIELEKKAQAYILKNIQKAIGANRVYKLIVDFYSCRPGVTPSLTSFLNESGLTPNELYQKNCSFARLCVSANLIPEFQDQEQKLNLEENIFSKALLWIARIDSRRWIRFLLDKLLPNLSLAYMTQLSELELRYLKMFWVTIYKNNPPSNLSQIFTDLEILNQNPVLLAEIKELLTWNYHHIKIVDHEIPEIENCPLDIYCTYSRDQLLVGLGNDKPRDCREGVKYLENINTDVLLVTLNKSDRDYTPTTLYEDYSINEQLFHWQSQSTTSEASKTGMRYIQGTSKILLFVRETKNVNNVAESYSLLGLCDYVSHTGSKPMSITWKMRRNIPAKFLKRTNQLLIG